MHLPGKGRPKKSRLSYSTWVLQHLGSDPICDKNPCIFESQCQISRKLVVLYCTQKMYSQDRFCTTSDKWWPWLYHWRFQKVPTHAHTGLMWDHGSQPLLAYGNIKINEHEYRISSYSCHGNYSFLEVGVRQVFKWGNYLREETIGSFYFLDPL